MNITRKRILFEEDEGYAWVATYHLGYSEFDDLNDIGKIRLAIHLLEDLGFTPEDIVMMAKFYKEQTSVEAITANMKLVQKLMKLENYETLEKEGRLIVKPAEEELLEDNV